MESNSKVTVKIYGREYIISGEKDREHIVKVAAYVDNQMHQIANAAISCPVNDLAVLSAVNIADESFECKEEVAELKKLNAQLEKDAQHYVQLWDEAKKNFHQYKEETQGMVDQNERLRKELTDKDHEMRDIKVASEKAAEKLVENSEKEIEELQEKCKELENTFFELQMENLQLKKDLESCQRELQEAQIEKEAREAQERQELREAQEAQNTESMGESEIVPNME